MNTDDITDERIIYIIGRLFFYNSKDQEFVLCDNGFPTIPLKDMPIKALKDIDVKLLKDLPLWYYKNLPLNTLRELPKDILKIIPVKIPTGMSKNMPLW